MAHIKKAILTLLVFSMLAGVSTNTNAITAIDTPSCGNWVESRQAKRSYLERAHNGGWLLGFMSGLAMKSGIDYLAKSDKDSLLLWVDNYCKANPLEYLDKAGYELEKELIEQKHLNR